MSASKREISLLHLTRHGTTTPPETILCLTNDDFSHANITNTIIIPFKHRHDGPLLRTIVQITTTKQGRNVYSYRPEAAGGMKRGGVTTVSAIAQEHILAAVGRRSTNYEEVPSSQNIGYVGSRSIQSPENFQVMKLVKGVFLLLLSSDAFVRHYVRTTYPSGSCPPKIKNSVRTHLPLFVWIKNVYVR